MKQRGSSSGGRSCVSTPTCTHTYAGTHPWVSHEEIEAQRRKWLVQASMNQVSQEPSVLLPERWGCQSPAQPWTGEAAQISVFLHRLATSEFDCSVTSQLPYQICCLTMKAWVCFPKLNWNRFWIISHYSEWSSLHWLLWSFLASQNPESLLGVVFEKCSESLLSISDQAGPRGSQPVTADPSLCQGLCQALWYGHNPLITLRGSTQPSLLS